MSTYISNTTYSEELHYVSLGYTHSVEVPLPLNCNEWEVYTLQAGIRNIKLHLCIHYLAVKHFIYLEPSRQLHI